MKLNYKLKLIAVAVVLGVGVSHANASQINNLPTTITQNSDNWVMVQNENGVQTFFMKKTINGAIQIRIKFVNTTNEIINFVWSLNKKSNLFFENVTNSINPLSFIEIDETTMMVPLKNGESFDDFSVTINLK